MEELYILWTNADPVTAQEMVFLYGHNALKRGWFEKVTLIIWGSTASLAAENPEVRAKLKEMIADGVHVSACRKCAEDLGAAEALEELGVEVIYWGEGLTKILKEGRTLLTV
jgi:hypothetical protein